VAYGVSGDRQVGFANIGGVDRAGLWSGSASSWVSLHPAGASASEADGVFEGQQVGFARIGGVRRAGVWSGTAASWVDLHALLPSGYTESGAQCIWRDGHITYVAGYGFNSMTARFEALLWTEAVTPTCAVDTNNDGIVNSDDFFVFLTGYFGLQPFADFNHDALINSSDFFDFVLAFFAGC
jgi:hypothetical protein